MPRITPKEIIETTPNIIRRIYDENSRETGFIADNFAVCTDEEIEDILKQIGKLWGNSCTGNDEKDERGY